MCNAYCREKSQVSPSNRVLYSNVKTCGYVLSWIFDYNLASSITSLLLLTLMTAGLAWYKCWIMFTFWKSSWLISTNHALILDFYERKKAKHILGQMNNTQAKHILGQTSCLCTCVYFLHICQIFVASFCI